MDNSLVVEYLVACVRSWAVEVPHQILFSSVLKKKDLNTNIFISKLLNACNEVNYVSIPRHSLSFT